MTLDRRLAFASIWAFALAVVILLPGAADRWTLPKLAVAAIGVALAGFAPATGRLPRWLALAGGLLAVVLLAAALAGADPAGQLLGRWPRYEGLVALPVYAGSIWAGARLLGPGDCDSAARRRHAVVAFSVVAVLIAGEAGLESVGLRPISSDLARPGSLLGQASDEGLVGVVLVALLGTVAVGRWRRRDASTLTWTATVGVVAGLATVLLSASRGALVALGVVVLLGAVPGLRGVWRRAWPWVLGAVVAVAGLAFAIPATRDRVLGASPVDAASAGERLQLWASTWRLVTAGPERLLLGLGPSGFADALPAALPGDWFARVGTAVVTDSPHGWPFQVLAAGGLLGLALVLVALGWGAVQAVRRLRAASGAVSIAPSASSSTLPAAPALPAASAPVSVLPPMAGTAEEDWVRGAILAMVGAGVAWTTTFTIGSTAPLVGVLAGSVLAARLGTAGIAGARARDPKRVRWSAGTVLSVWAGWLCVVAASGVPLQQGIEAAAAGDTAAAEAGFGAAAAIRPWDADVDLLAAEAYATAADQGASTSAAAVGTPWAGRAVDRLPDSVRALKAAIVLAEHTGDTATALADSAEALALSPNDPQLHTARAVADLLAGDGADGVAELRRAAALAPGDDTPWHVLLDYAQQVGDGALVAEAQSHLGC